MLETGEEKVDKDADKVNANDSKCIDRGDGIEEELPAYTPGGECKQESGPCQQGQQDAARRDQIHLQYRQTRKDIDKTRDKE